MLRKITQISVMLMLAIAAAGVSAAPANAAAVDLYQDVGFTGGYAGRGTLVSSYHGQYFNNGHRLWDAVSALRNNRGHWTTFWTNHHCGGAGYGVEPWGTRSWVGSKFNDTFSSHAPEWYQNGC